MKINIARNDFLALLFVLLIGSAMITCSYEVGKYDSEHPELRDHTIYHEAEDDDDGGRNWLDRVQSNNPYGGN